MDNKHISVLLNESIEGLKIKKEGIYVDCTLGGGGHSAQILAQIKDGHLFAFDQDTYAIKVASEKLSKIGDNFTVINENFVKIKECLNSLGIFEVDGILYDLGVSSFQLDMAERGFSYRFDGPLDMRMNQQDSLTASIVVNDYSLPELKRILYEYGEERFAPLIAQKIVLERTKQPINSTLQLVDIIKKALPASVLRKDAHPAKKTFQAIRIEVNHELDYLKKSINDGLELLCIGGRMVVISFHSLEDRIVKQIFKERTSINLPKDMPIIPPEYEPKFALVNKKIIVPTENEINENLRSHAKMRIIERVK